MIPLPSLPLSDSLSPYNGTPVEIITPVVGPLPWSGIVSSEKEDLKSSYLWPAITCLSHKDFFRLRDDEARCVGRDITPCYDSVTHVDILVWWLLQRAEIE